MKIKKGPGRPHLDLAIRMRNWGWYSLIKEGSGLSDDRLDKKYVKVKFKERPRLFFQMQSVGSSPNELRGYHSRKSIYELVHAGGKFERARQWFEAPLWWILTNPGLGLEDFRGFIAKEAERRQWFRAAPDEIRPGSWVFDGEEPAFVPEATLDSNTKSGYGPMISRLANSQDIEDIALLCALFREAYHAFDLDLARRLGNLVEPAVVEFVSTLPLERHFKECLHQLIYDRVVKNLWISEASMQAVQRSVPKHRAAQIRRFMTWYMLNSNPHRISTHACRYPIVIDSPRTRWFRQNKSKIRELWDAARPLSESDYEDEVHKFDGTSAKEIAELEERLGQILERSKFDPERERRAREQLRTLGEIPPPIGSPFLPAPPPIPAGFIEWDDYITSR